MKKLIHISLATARVLMVLLLLVSLTSAGASSARRICKPILEPHKAQVVTDTGVELKPDPMSEEASSDNMAGSSRPYSEQDAAQIGQWFSPNIEKPQVRRVHSRTGFDATVTQLEGSHGPAVIGSLAEASPDQNDQATLVGSRPSGTM